MGGPRGFTPMIARAASRPIWRPCMRADISRLSIDCGATMASTAGSSTAAFPASRPTDHSWATSARPSILPSTSGRRNNSNPLSAQLILAQDEERRRIARELHDSTVQTVMAVK